jgi:hypothetical protein
MWFSIAVALAIGRVEHGLVRSRCRVSLLDLLAEQLFPCFLHERDQAHLSSGGFAAPPKGRAERQVISTLAALLPFVRDALVQPLEAHGLDARTPGRGFPCMTVRNLKGQRNSALGVALGVQHSQQAPRLTSRRQRRRAIITRIAS